MRRTRMGGISALVLAAGLAGCASRSGAEKPAVYLHIENVTQYDYQTYLMVGSSSPWRFEFVPQGQTRVKVLPSYVVAAGSFDFVIRRWPGGRMVLSDQPVIVREGESVVYVRIEVMERLSGQVAEDDG